MVLVVLVGAGSAGVVCVGVVSVGGVDEGVVEVESGVVLVGAVESGVVLVVEVESGVVLVPDDGVVLVGVVDVVEVFAGLLTRPLSSRSFWIAGDHRISDLHPARLGDASADLAHHHVVGGAVHEERAERRAQTHPTRDAVGELRGVVRGDPDVVGPASGGNGLGGRGADRPEHDARLRQPRPRAGQYPSVACEIVSQPWMRYCFWARRLT